MQLAEIVPWGRSFDEYCAIFDLSHDDLLKKILGCGDGPASFNADLTERGGQAISVDPIYEFSKNQVKKRIDEVYAEIIDQVTKTEEDFIWKTIPNVQTLGKVRMQAMQKFLDDYNHGLEAGRYVCAKLPKLPFQNAQFDLALCSHFLFLYSQHFGPAEHIDSMRELCRVAAEVRVYPLVTLDGQPSPHLPSVIQALQNANISVELRPVRYRFQKGATEMLVAINEPFP